MRIIFLLWWCLSVGVDRAAVEQSLHLVLHLWDSYLAILSHLSIHSMIAHYMHVPCTITSMLLHHIQCYQYQHMRAFLVKPYHCLQGGVVSGRPSLMHERSESVRAVCPWLASLKKWCTPPYTQKGKPADYPFCYLYGLHIKHRKCLKLHLLAYISFFWDWLPDIYV